MMIITFKKAIKRLTTQKTGERTSSFDEQNLHKAYVILKIYVSETVWTVYRPAVLYLNDDRPRHKSRNNLI